MASSRFHIIIIRDSRICVPPSVNDQGAAYLNIDFFEQVYVFQKSLNTFSVAHFQNGLFVAGATDAHKERRFFASLVKICEVSLPGQIIPASKEAADKKGLKRRRRLLLLIFYSSHPFPQVLTT